MTRSPAPVRNTADKIADALRQAIQTGKLQPGQALFQDAIADQFRVSRVPVREAMKQLENEGLLSIRPHRGTTVTLMTPDEVRELYEMRGLLERHLLATSIPLLDPAIFKQAEGLLREMDTEKKLTRWAQQDAAFHALLYSGAQKPRMLELTEKLRVATNRFYYLNGAGGGRHLDKCRHRHRAILRAAKAGDVAGAVAQLDLHLAEAAEEVARDAERHQLSA